MKLKTFYLYAAREIMLNDPTFSLYVAKYSKIFKKVCNKAKSLFLKNKIINAPNKVRATWRLINNETGKSKPRNKEIKLKIYHS